MILLDVIHSELLPRNCCLSYSFVSQFCARLWSIPSLVNDDFQLTNGQRIRPQPRDMCQCINDSSIVVGTLYR